MTNQSEPTKPSNDQQEARERVISFLPFLRNSVAKARDAGTLRLAVIAEKEDGSGHVFARFDCDDFMRDLEAALAPTAEEIAQHRLMEFNEPLGHQ